MASESVDEDNLKISNAGSDGQYLQKQSGNSGGLTWATVSSTPDAITEGNTSVEVIDTGSDGNIRFTTEGTEIVRITSDGKIGGGSGLPTSPSDNIHWRASSGTNYARFTTHDAGNDKSLKVGVNSSGDGVLSGLNDTHVIFASNNTERMRLTNEGHLCVGTTAELNPSGNKPVFNAFNAQPCAWFETSAGGEYCISVERSSAAGTFVQFINNSGNSCGTINNADSAGSAAYSSSSDYRLKENTSDITDGITKVKELKPIRFNWKGEDKSRKFQGFLAHEVKSVVPLGCVTGTKDEVDSDNNPVHQAMDYGRLTPILTAALKEAIAKIETLETKVAALEAK
tara:strand:- start:324 stop:1346 length:1023 start_codon:yes stop_codon:yes gene_type:complete